jgi:hypothetical protein
LVNWKITASSTPLAEPDISRFIGDAQVPLRSGEVLAAYTDGITEAVNSAGMRILRFISQKGGTGKTTPVNQKVMVPNPVW